MAEAEEVITDVARHATVFTRDLWHRYRQRSGAGRPLELADVTERLSLLISSVFGTHHVIRTAQSPAPPNLFDSLFSIRRGPIRRQALPATNGSVIWLPVTTGSADRDSALQVFRAMAMQQAMRAQRGSAAALPADAPELVQDLYLLLEAQAADQALIGLLPGMARAIDHLREFARKGRPPLDQFPRHQQALERYVLEVLQTGVQGSSLHASTDPADSVRLAAELADELTTVRGNWRPIRLWPDLWTGQLAPPEPVTASAKVRRDDGDDEDDSRPESGRLPRRPEIREASEEDEEDGNDSGNIMVQADEPHEKAEDPMGIQRPTDRDDEANPDHLGDMLSELPEARLVTTPERPREVLLSDEPPAARSFVAPSAERGTRSRFVYPEWDYRIDAYRDPGAVVLELPPQTGPQAWVDETMREHQAMLEVIRRRFEMLQAQRVVFRRQLDGEEIDLAACIDGLADLRAGGRLPEELYQRCQPAERNLAIMLLIDVSGSTDAWVSANRRIIDVEREALLLVCIALRAMREPYAVQAFSGEGPEQVTVRPIMDFDETFSDDVALRIAALEPERFTRAGAALRHATGALMQQPASDRLLLLLSDGKPNDVDQYEGRYGIEDMRQAVNEARMQGVHPFCLTIDRQASDYLPRIFGANQYAMLPKSELLPTVLLDWMRRLIATRQA